MRRGGVHYLSHPPGSGYGEAAEEYISALRGAGIPVSWTPLVWGSDAWGPGHAFAPFTGRTYGGARHDDICNLPLDCETVLVHCQPIWHDGWSGRGRPRRLVAYTTHEADRLPASWVPILNRYDAVLVPSTHNLQVFRSSGVTVPVDVVPHIARLPPTEALPNRSRIRPGLFVFYVVGTWTARKAMPETITAFLEAFTAADDVALLVKTTAEDHVALHRLGLKGDGSPAGHEGQSWWSLARLLASYRSPPEVHLDTRDVPAPVMHAMYAHGDCFFSLTRGEGWGLGAFHAAAAGKPVVLTGWGGHLDYLPPGYPFCVRYRLASTVEDEPDGWFQASPEQRWARADLDHAITLLRRIYEERDDARVWGELLQQSIADHFTARRVLPRLLSALAPA